MRSFVLKRNVDVSGVSGTGVVAEGVQFSDRTVALRWVTKGNPGCVSFWDSIEDVRKIHGHEGSTQVQWEDHAVGYDGNEVTLNIPYMPRDSFWMTGRGTVFVFDADPDREWVVRAGDIVTFGSNRRVKYLVNSIEMMGRPDKTKSFGLLVRQVAP